MYARRAQNGKINKLSDPIAGSGSPLNAASRPAVPVLQKRPGWTNASVIQRSSPSTGTNAGIQMTIEITAGPADNVQWYDYSKPKPVMTNEPLTNEQFFNLWEKLNSSIDNIVENDLAKKIFTGPLMIELARIQTGNQKSGKRSGEFHLSHAAIVNWHSEAIKILPPGQNTQEGKDLKKLIDGMLVLTNLMNDMSDANTKQRKTASAKTVITNLSAFYIGTDTNVSAMVTVDMKDPDLPYIANLWGEAGKAKELMAALPTLLGKTKFRLHALSSDIADLYRKSYKGKEI